MHPHHNNSDAFAPFTLSIFKTGTITEKGVLGLKCDPFPLSAFVWNIFLLDKYVSSYARVTLKMRREVYVVLTVKYPVLLSSFNQIWNVLTNFCKLPQCQILWTSFQRFSNVKRDKHSIDNGHIANSQEKHKQTIWKQADTAKWHINSFVTGVPRDFHNFRRMSVSDFEKLVTVLGPPNN
jgi:hypothetical protein